MFKLLLITVLLILPLSSSASGYEISLKKADSCLNVSSYEESIEFYKQALALLENEQIEKRSEIYIRLGYIFKVLEMYDDAFLVFDKALILERRLNNLELSMNIKIGYAEFLRCIGQCEKAMQVIESLDVENEIERSSKTIQAFYYNRWAAILVQCFNDFEKAMRVSKKGLMLARQAGSTYHEAASLNEMGFITEHTDSPKNAIPLYKVALRLWDDEKYLRYAPNACVNISRCYSRVGKLDSTLYFANKGLEKVGDRDWFRMLVPLYSEKLFALEQMDRWREAYFTRGLYHEAAINMRAREWSDKMATARGEFELERKETELTTERSKNEQAKQEIDNERRIIRWLIFVVSIVLFLALAAFFLFIRLRRANANLKDSLAENDVLLKEVHHRVKNNMQVVSSLLDLQSSFAMDEKSKNALINSRDRINSLALAHQNLYVDDDLQSINVKNYLEVLIESLVGQDVHVKQEIHEGQLEIEKAQALGFVLNELLTNSMKHAWKSEDREKLIWIKLIKREEEWSFYYADNGVGLKDKAKFLESPTFGVTLIRSFLKRNFKVSISFGEKPGMNVGFTFK